MYIINSEIIDTGESEFDLREKEREAERQTCRQTSTNRQADQRKYVVGNFVKEKQQQNTTTTTIS